MWSSRIIILVESWRYIITGVGTSVETEAVEVSSNPTGAVKKQKYTILDHETVDPYDFGIIQVQTNIRFFDH